MLQTSTPADLARKLMAKFATNTDDTFEGYVPISAFSHTTFGGLALQYFRSVRCASMQCMLGAVEAPKVKVKAQKKAKAKVVLGKELQPDQLDTRKQDDRNETSKLAESMFSQVQENHGQPYAHFVLNHNSFAQTVENMFSVAMLVGNAQVALRHDEEWGMSVHLVKGQFQGVQVPSLGKGESAQMVLNMNYDMWQAMKDAVDPGDCLTPHRAAIRLANDEPHDKGAAGSGGGAGAVKRKAGTKRAAKGSGSGLTSSEDEGDADAPGPSKKKARKAAA
jgi:non-structural maintenance of chromosomes element 4